MNFENFLVGFEGKRRMLAETFEQARRSIDAYKDSDNRVLRSIGQAIDKIDVKKSQVELKPFVWENELNEQVLNELKGKVRGARGRSVSELIRQERSQTRACGEHSVQRHVADSKGIQAA